MKIQNIKIDDYNSEAEICLYANNGYVFYCTITSDDVDFFTIKKFFSFVERNNWKLENADKEKILSFLATFCDRFSEGETQQ